jgi:hypothetical protein
MAALRRNTRPLFLASPCRLDDAAQPVGARLDLHHLLITRPVAQALTEAYSTAGLDDVADAGARRATVFDALIEPETGPCVSNLDALWWRWKGLSDVPSRCRRRAGRTCGRPAYAEAASLW